MTLLHKIFLTHNRRSRFVSFISITVRNRAINSKLMLYRFRLYIEWLIRRKSVELKVMPLRASIKGGDIKGFTLVELIVTIVILAIIATIAAPAILHLLADMEAKSIKSQLESALSLAKAESYIRRQNVLLCLSNSAGRCHRDSDKTLLLFIDSNDNNHFDAQSDYLLSQQSLNLKYSKLSLRVGSKRHYTKFWGDSGTPRGHFGHIKYCPTSGYNQSTYLISFSQTGVVKQKLNEDHPTECDK